MRPKTETTIRNELNNTSKGSEAYEMLEALLPRASYIPDPEANRILGFAMAIRVMEASRDMSVFSDILWDDILENIHDMVHKRNTK